MISMVHLRSPNLTPLLAIVLLIFLGVLPRFNDVMTKKYEPYILYGALWKCLSSHIGELKTKGSVFTICLLLISLIGILG